MKYRLPRLMLPEGNLFRTPSSRLDSLSVVAASGSLRSREGKARGCLRLSSLITTSAVGALEYGLAGGILYSTSLILILLCHEMGHYLTARHYAVPASLPYFIPSPLPPFGTFGAVIKMGGRIPHRKALFDIAIMGPAMGLVLALPLAVLGIAWSTVTSLDSMPAGETFLGPSILFSRSD